MLSRYRTIVVGRGMLGAAAARHLSAMHEGVAIVGPDEPKDRRTHRGVFASHYDEGRMTRIADADPIWALTAARSIARYREIESASGIRFHSPAGYLGLASPGVEALGRAATVANGLGAPVTRLDARAIATRFPFVEVSADATALYESGAAGYISPRAMVEAETAVALSQGAQLHRAAATAVRITASGVEVDTSHGKTVRADRVLVAAGAFTEVCGLVGVRLGLEVFGRTVVLARLDDALLADLGAMPTMGHADTGAYILPPIRYPDGHCYLKLGIGSPDDLRLHTLEALRSWFAGPGSDSNRRDFQAFIVALIPALAACGSWHADTCVVTRTESGLPIIDFVHGKRVAVAVGGNGKGAKSADEWGRIAAALVAGAQWDPSIPRDALRVPGGPSR